jgi:glycosyltransferase 2 family protein
MKGTLIRFAISAFLLAAMFWYVDLSQVWARIAQVGIGDFIFCCVLMLGLFVAGALRWRAILASGLNSVPISWAINVTVIGQFFNQLLPSSVGGDALRALYAARAGIPLGVAVRSVLLDRVAGFAFMVIVGACLSPNLVLTSGLQPTVLLMAVMIALGLGGLLAVLITDQLPFAARVARKRKEKTAKPIWRLLDGCYQLGPVARQAFRQPAVAICSMTMIAGYCGIIWYQARSVGVQISMLEVFTTIPLALVMSAVPISLAGWGLREGAMVAVLSLVHVEAHSAFAISVLFGLTVAAASVVGGVLWCINPIHLEKIQPG